LGNISLLEFELGLHEASSSIYNRKGELGVQKVEGNLVLKTLILNQKECMQEVWLCHISKSHSLCLGHY